MLYNTIMIIDQTSIQEDLKLKGYEKVKQEARDYFHSQLIVLKDREKEYMEQIEFFNNKNNETNI